MCNCYQGNLMDSTQLTQYGIAAALLFGVYKFGGKYGAAGAMAVAAVIVAKRVPYVQNVL